MTTTSPDPETQAQKTIFIVTHRLNWKRKTLAAGATFEATKQEIADEPMRAYLAHGWVHREGERPAAAVPTAKGTPAPIPRAGSGASVPGNQVQMVPLDKIRPDPTQPRKTFAPEAMAELVDSIKAHGVEQAILVRPRNPQGGAVGPDDGWRFGWYEIVYGERRWRASKEAGLTEIPAKVRDLTDIEAAEKQGIENLERADLLPLEVAAQYRKLLDLPGYGMERLMAVTGHAKNTIYGKLKLLDLPEDGIKAVQTDRLQASVGELIGRQESELRGEALKRVLKPERGYYSTEDRSKPVTYKEAEKIIDNLKDERKQAQLRKQAASEAEGRGMRIVQLTSTEYTKRGQGDLTLSGAFFVSSDAQIVAEDSKLKIWKYPIMERRTRYIAGPTAEFWGTDITL